MAPLQEILFGVSVRGDRPNKVHQFNIIPGQIKLVGLESASGAFGVQVVIVMRFTCYDARPDLVNSTVLGVKIYPFNLPVAAFVRSFVVEGSNPGSPKASGSEKATDKCDPINEEPDISNYLEPRIKAKCTRCSLTILTPSLKLIRPKPMRIFFMLISHNISQCR